MSQMLGRALLPGENVHHRNGIRDDNRPENLELWTSHQPPGQRATDLVDFAIEILRKYDPDHLRHELSDQGELLHLTPLRQGEGGWTPPAERG